MKRIVPLPALAVVLMLGIAGAFAVTFSPVVSKASAYVLSNGCDEYDPARGITYRCTPDRSTFYTPDGVDPTRVGVGTGYGNINDTPGIPPAAPYVSGRDYCSNPWYGNSSYEGKFQYTCYRHDVCYGSQLGRKYCDTQFWKNLLSDCKSFGWYNPDRYSCFVDARTWYYAVRWFGDSHYKPRSTSFEPRGE